jgi:glycerol-3-phosphate acyltransferase PlsX
MIAVDAMGGDFAPREIILGAVAAAQQGIPVCLFGDQSVIKKIIVEQKITISHLPLSLVHTTQVIDMGQEPTRAVLDNLDSSLVAAVNAVKEGQCAAVVSAGNTGACLAAGTLMIGRASGILRPAIGNLLPTKKGSVFCIDLGANPDSKPEWLMQFAHMGIAYQNLFFSLKNPRVGLLSNGTEEYKGSRAHKQAFELLKTSHLNFVGNVEPADVLNGTVDVLVSDGFVGNIFLKTMEATGSLVQHFITQTISSSWFDIIWFGLRRSVFKRVKARAMYDQVGGALLLGLQKPLIVAHGCSNAQAIEQAIRFAHKVVQENMIEKFNHKIVPILDIPRTITPAFSSDFNPKEI